MTTFTGDLNVKALDSSVTAVNITRGGGATFTGPFVLTSSIAVSGDATFYGSNTFSSGTLTIGQASAGGMVATTAGNPQLTGPIGSGGRMACRGLVAITVAGTTGFVPFYFST